MGFMNEKPAHAWDEPMIGHFQKEEENIEEGENEMENQETTGFRTEPREMEDNDGGSTERRAFGIGAGATAESVFIETGRGQTAEVHVGENFAETVERVSNAAHYGGYYRVFLNGDEIINPAEAPEKILSGMRIAITAYDKVGVSDNKFFTI
jgi:hypothetical protein